MFAALLSHLLTGNFLKNGNPAVSAFFVKNKNTLFESC